MRSPKAVNARPVPSLQIEVVRSVPRWSLCRYSRITSPATGVSRHRPAVVRVAQADARATLLVQTAPDSTTLVRAHQRLTSALALLVTPSSHTRDSAPTFQDDNHSQCIEDVPVRLTQARNQLSARTGLGTRRKLPSQPRHPRTPGVTRTSIPGSPQEAKRQRS